jgi:hypothetical protein
VVLDQELPQVIDGAQFGHDVGALGSIL